MPECEHKDLIVTFEWQETKTLIKTFKGVDWEGVDFESFEDGEPTSTSGTATTIETITCRTCSATLDLDHIEPDMRDLFRENA